MRHRVGHRKLGRVTEHRIALLRNQAEALLTHGRITTTVPKAKELRGFVDHLIHLAKRGDLHARRLVLRDLQDVKLVRKLFDEIAPRYRDRQGGYTRVLKLAERRRGDGAPLALVELVE
mgnify:CR=1 FL=1